jgi:hypothetical protein
LPVRIYRHWWAFNKTAEARKRPEIESYNRLRFAVATLRCALRIACAMALFAGPPLRIDISLRVSIVETQNLASLQVFGFTGIGGRLRGIFFARLAPLCCFAKRHCRMITYRRDARFCVSCRLREKEALTFYGNAKCGRNEPEPLHFGASCSREKRRIGFTDILQIPQTVKNMP